jgi:Nucleotidyl transferase AbiEii toxin, Type IV TA system
VGGKARVGLSQGITRALEELAPVLDMHRGHSLVIGGIAVIARGVPRVTRDIDIAFSGADVTLQGLVAELERAGIVSRIDDALAFAAESQVLLSRHAQTGVDIDVSFAWLPFELEAIAAAGPAMVGSAKLQVAQPEDLVIYKAIAWRPQDQQDVERLLALHGGRMDLSRIRRHVRDLGEAMEQDRVPELDAVIRRILGA